MQLIRLINESLRLSILIDKYVCKDRALRLWPKFYRCLFTIVGVLWLTHKNHLADKSEKFSVQDEREWENHMQFFFVFVSHKSKVHCTTKSTAFSHANRNQFSFIFSFIGSMLFCLLNVFFFLGKLWTEPNGYNNMAVCTVCQDSFLFLVVLKCSTIWPTTPH